MRTLISICNILAGQHFKAVQTELALTRIQINYITHAEIRLCAVGMSLINQIIIIHSQLLIFSICIQCAISFRAINIY